MLPASAPKVLAFHLPQFHRIPENDLWWGDGFTDWTNVRKARQLFPGHTQPRVPAEGRYYDMLDPAVHDWQAALAHEYGIHGFCYYHYWFGGKQLLEKPVELLLRRGKPDIPFCLAWANEPWTRAWDGGDQQILMPQSYGTEADWLRHFDYLKTAFADARYIRVDGKPMFVIYRTASIDVCEPMIACWRREALRAGFPGLHIVSMLTGFAIDKRKQIFDAFVEFEPGYTYTHRRPYWFRKRERWAKQLTRLQWRVFGSARRAPNSYDYDGVWRAITARELEPNTYPGAFVDWDNSPRRSFERAMVLRNVNGAAFQRGIREQFAKANRVGAEFLFINAWNEWAEGTYLEPDEARGLFYLEAIRAARAEFARESRRAEAV